MLTSYFQRKSFRIVMRRVDTLKALLMQPAGCRVPRNMAEFFALHAGEADMEAAWRILRRDGRQAPAPEDSREVLRKAVNRALPRVSTSNAHCCAGRRRRASMPTPPPA